MCHINDQLLGFELVVLLLLNNRQGQRNLVLKVWELYPTLLSDLRFDASLGHGVRPFSSRFGL